MSEEESTRLLIRMSVTRNSFPVAVTLESVGFFFNLSPFKGGGEHSALGFYMIPSASYSGSSHANDLQENGNYLHKNGEVAEGRVAAPPAWKINNIYIINIVRENQGSDDFSPAGLKKGRIKGTDKAPQPARPISVTYPSAGG